MLTRQEIMKVMGEELAEEVTEREVLDELYKELDKAFEADDILRIDSIQFAIIDLRRKFIRRLYGSDSVIL